MLKPNIAAVVLALVGGSAAVAQDTGHALIDSLFNQAQAELLQGARPAAQARGSLAAETTGDQTFNLRAGRTYLAIGMCDEGCTDLDFAVFSPSGDNLGSDVEDDDTPVVSFEATANGQYKATVLMAACGAARCNYQVRIYEQ
ncbi:hypothetical protein GVN24_28095 [Rhizobium sp. CRIBSB]|nr:hypothetical protein [Rhizobium sp. CRIBSB]